MLNTFDYIKMKTFGHMIALLLLLWSVCLSNALTCLRGHYMDSEVFEENSINETRCPRRANRCLRIEAEVFAFGFVEVEFYHTACVTERVCRRTCSQYIKRLTGQGNTLDGDVFFVGGCNMTCCSTSLCNQARIGNDGPEIRATSTQTMPSTSGGIAQQSEQITSFQTDRLPYSSIETLETSTVYDQPAITPNSSDFTATNALSISLTSSLSFKDPVEPSIKTSTNENIYQEIITENTRKEIHADFTLGSSATNLTTNLVLLCFLALTAIEIIGRS